MNMDCTLLFVLQRTNFHLLLLSSETFLYLGLAPGSWELYICASEPGSRACTGCRNMHYCSLECQEADWHVESNTNLSCHSSDVCVSRHAHKHFCSAFKNFTTPPNEQVARVIMLPETSKMPYSIWLPITGDELVGTIPGKVAATTRLRTIRRP